jgi:hypothetical protein
LAASKVIIATVPSPIAFQVLVVMAHLHQGLME